MMGLLVCPLMAGTIGAGAESCTGSPVSALGYTWQVCGNAFEDFGLTVNSTTGSVNISPLSTFAGSGYTESYKGITGTDGSAARMTFDGPYGGTLEFTISGFSNVVYYALVLLDGKVVADAYSQTAEASVYESAHFTVPIAAGGPHTLAVVVTNGIYPSEGVGTFADPWMAMSSLSIALNDGGTGVPEPGTVMVGVVVAGLGWWRRRR